MQLDLNRKAGPGRLVEIRAGTYLTRAGFQDNEYFVRIMEPEWGLIVSEEGSSKDMLYSILRSNKKEVLIAREHEIRNIENGNK